MKKPERKDCPRYGATYDKELEIKTDSYNLAIDTYAAFLPMEKEIKSILMLQEDLKSKEEYADFMGRLAKAIAERLGKE